MAPWILAMCAILAAPVCTVSSWQAAQRSTQARHGPLAARRTLSGKREFHVAIRTNRVSPSPLSASEQSALRRYLDEAAGASLEPNVTFVVREDSAALIAYAAAGANNLDFAFVDSTVATCIESEHSFSPMVTYRRGGISEVGAVVVALKASSIATLQDLRDKVVAASDASLLYQLQGVAQDFSLVMMAAQVRMVGSGKINAGDKPWIDAIANDLIAERVDAALMTSSQLNQLPANISAQLRTVGEHARDFSHGGRFPFNVTSGLFPEKSVVSAPHVPWEVQREVERERNTATRAETRACARARALTHRRALAHSNAHTHTGHDCPVEAGQWNTKPQLPRTRWSEF